MTISSSTCQDFEDRIIWPIERSEVCLQVYPECIMDPVGVQCAYVIYTHTRTHARAAKMCFRADFRLMIVIKVLNPLHRSNHKSQSYVRVSHLAV
jgi:hypothetical protein